MDGSRVHFEVFVRKVAGGPWTLDRATESRAAAIEIAEGLMAAGRVAAVRVSKEVFDEETREFNSVVILKLGQAEVVAKARPQVEAQPLCVTPQDLYTLHARERIGRLLEGWLERNNATPFELLHRPDLVEKLEASGVDLQHAIQKIAVPEAHARAMSVHELIRVFQALVLRAIERLLKDHRRGALPNLDKEGFARAADRLATDAERGYLLGAGVAASIAAAASPEQLAELERQLGLDRPAYEQYFSWLAQTLTGDLGTSYVNGANITQQLLVRVPVTFELTLWALGIEGDRRARVREVLQQVGLDRDAADRFPHQFSGGQRQRIALARAIVHRPRILVGDEPLSALDVTVRAQILRLLAELRAEQQLTLVLVSHDIGVVQNVCDEVVVMKDGRVVEQGPTEKVLLQPQAAYTRQLLASVPTLPG